MFHLSLWGCIFAVASTHRVKVEDVSACQYPTVYDQEMNLGDYLMESGGAERCKVTEPIALNQCLAVHRPKLMTTCRTKRYSVGVVTKIEEQKLDKALEAAGAPFPRPHSNNESWPEVSRAKELWTMHKAKYSISRPGKKRAVAWKTDMLCFEQPFCPTGCVWNGRYCLATEEARELLTRS
eukprot:TRINITY_DN65231_c0_g1_i1.p1 TRINITY_DN65231_c0_g1~~TRINITY_DN65231_c0_g1_i1.p1  ORF type:complete len:181 (+),score=19.67 TRINITY_DN65231_c0_g1_i1:65-607(+)